MATLGQFGCQLEALLRRDGNIMISLTYKGASLSPDSKLHNFITQALAISQAPRLVVSYKRVVSDEKPAKRRKVCLPAESQKGRVDDEYQVFVKDLTGGTLTLLCRPLMLVNELKMLIHDEEGIPTDQQRLVFSGRQLEDLQTLAECGIERESLIHLLLRLLGGGPAPAPFADVSKTSFLEAMPFRRDAPRWREASKGLDVEGICRNKSCAAHGEMVIDGRGMVAFSLQTDKAHCPECETQFQPTTCGFHSCMWAFDGRKEGSAGPEDVSGEWKEASGGVYHRFEEEGNTINWHSLILTTRQLFRGKSPCPICFENISYRSRTEAVGCTHSFHPECLKAWKLARPNKVCPLC